MTSYQKFHKLKGKLKDRDFLCKEFFDINGEKLDFNEGKQEAVYLKSEVDEVVELIKTHLGTILDENVILHKKNEDLELENFRLQKSLKRKKSK